MLLCRETLRVVESLISRDIYKVTTGTGKGNCAPDTNNGVVTKITCKDGDNVASASCSKEGSGVCGESTGSGGCDIVPGK
jgi:hypothetical protein